MPIIRHKHAANYTVVPNEILRNKTLSLRDIGLLCYLLSLPDDWEFSILGLTAVLPHDGRDAIAASVKHIQEAGYLQYDRPRGKNGRIGKVIWIVSDTPM